MKYILYYPTVEDFKAAQTDPETGEIYVPGDGVRSIIPGVSWTVTEDVVDYNPIPEDDPTLIIVNETNTDSVVTLTAKQMGDNVGTLASRPKVSLKYSNNGSIFQTTASTDDPQTGEVLSFDLPANGRLYLKGKNDTFAVGKVTSTGTYGFDYSAKYWSFNCNVRHSLEGNLMALLKNDTAVTENFELAGLFEYDDMLREVSDTVLSSEKIPFGAYLRLFYQTQDTQYGLEKMPKIDAYEIESWGCYQTFGNATFETATEIPAMVLGSGACFQMFAGSKHLTGMTSDLPNASGNWYTWAGMFQNCTALTKAPNILVDHACPRSMMHMFSRCYSLVNPPEMHLNNFGFWDLDTNNYTIECCGYMFANCTSLVSTPTFFSALTGSNWVGFIFQYMFVNCTSLTQAADLGYGLVGQYAYRSMFQGCTSLVTPPKIKLTIVDKLNSCYEMFKDCTALTDAPQMNSITFYRDRCTNSFAYMFDGCTALTGTTNITFAATTNPGCYAYMFRGCTSLTSVPSLPATALTNTCYSGMFSGCTNLSQITCLATDLSAANCTSNWVDGVQTQSGTFTKAASADWTVKTGNDGIPANWTVVNAS